MIENNEIKNEEMNQNLTKKMNKKRIIILIVIMLAIAITGMIIGIAIVNNMDGETLVLGPSEIENIPAKEPKKEVEIFKGNDRPIAVMIDNEKPAWPHAGLNDAYLLYEIIIEGGESRIMALFKGQNTEKIGPVRSSRHYFLDYALENDAMYVHFGWSPMAQQQIKQYSVNNLNGVTNDGVIFWREGNKKSYHNAFTSIEKILNRAEKKGYRKLSTDKGVFTYSAEEIVLGTGAKANNVKLKYSGLQNVEYKYNETTKMYERHQRGIAHKDRFTDEIFTAKNIIVCYINNGLLDDPEQKGRQDLYNIGKGQGIYITNGEYMNITWEKTSKTSKTKYYDYKGNELVLNDGRTWVQIIPKANKAEIN